MMLPCVRRQERRCRLQPLPLHLHRGGNWASVVGINLNGTAPFLGPWLAQFLRAGQEIGGETLTRFYSLHMLLVPGAIIGLITLHLYLVIRLGVTSPPWSREAAGMDRVEEPTTARPGLTRPVARGAGGQE